MDEKLNRWTARFESPSVEAAFQSAKFHGDKGNNFRALLLAVPIFAGYALLDNSMLSDADAAVKFRLLTCAISAFILAAFQHPNLEKYQEFFTCCISLIMSGTIFFILYTQGNIDHNYYVGLIQGGVFICFLLRVGFVSASTVLLIYLFGFVASLSSHLSSDEVRAQIFILFSMFLICAFGNYLLQRYRRSDFIKSKTIELQNTQLKSLLADAEKDTQRKIAALNTLVHFVKTPIHQINGFSDVVLNSLEKLEQNASETPGIDGAKYIKDATANLTRSVNGLLAYHRLDELEARNEIETYSLDLAVKDFGDLLHREVDYSYEGAVGEIKASQEAISTAFLALSDYYRDRGGKVIISASAKREGSEIVINICDNLTTLSEEDFHSQTTPLIEIDSYLNTAGSEMPMALRTVARAVQIASGEFSHQPLEAGNKFEIRLSLGAAELAA